MRLQLFSKKTRVQAWCFVDFLRQGWHDWELIGTSKENESVRVCVVVSKTTHFQPEFSPLQISSWDHQQRFRLTHLLKALWKRLLDLFSLQGEFSSGNDQDTNSSSTSLRRKEIFILHFFEQQIARADEIVVYLKWMVPRDDSSLSSLAIKRERVDMLTRSANICW